MSIPEIDPTQSFAALADAQLQQELRSLFVVDTQTYLQKYSQIVQSLQASAWRTDIQELYRCIHTIKGGAVTVGAEAALSVATALEDVLSDLRYLEQAPDLSDGHLGQILLEAGELLTGTLESAQPGGIDPILQRIQTLHQDIRSRYLPQWDEIGQLHQEFAEQGLDLVVLELEIALEQLPEHGRVPDGTLQIARNILEQLTQIGAELQLAPGWTALLEQAQILLEHPTNSAWRSQWKPLFQALKTCAKQGGNPIPFEFPVFADELDDDQGGEPPGNSEVPAIMDSLLGEGSWAANSLAQTTSQTASLNLDWLEKVSPIEMGSIEVGNLEARNIETHDIEARDIAAWLGSLPIMNGAAELLTPIPEQSTAGDVELPAGDAELPQPFVAQRPTLPQDNAPSSLARSTERSLETPETVQIPVPLEKLDHSAQHIVETLIGLRTTQGVYQALQSQITQLITLAQEGIQYITHLRQIQDDYTLLEELRNSAQFGPTPERYRQGYTAINRLLEISLRLSEVGAETGKLSQQVTEYLQDVDDSVLKLQTTIEGSRLVPFQNLGFRAKAILRDLTIRYGKPARLLVQGEQTELDVGIARNLEPVLLHLIRNAYDHGLESASDRVAQGKSEQGQIVLSLQRQGHQFQLEIRDDGRGIDAQAVQARAEALGLPLTNTQTAAELLAVICQPGFSTQNQVNEISGRGIGMDVVAAQVASLGGQVSLLTEPGAGTTFRLQFPVPRLLIPCVLLQAGHYTFAIPDEGIKTMRLWSDLAGSPVEEDNRAYSWKIHDDTGSLPAIDLLEYWQQRSTQRPPADTTVCLNIAGTDGQSDVWLLADELLEQTELIIHPLPSPLIAPGGLIGLSLQSDGSLVPVLQARELAEQILSASAVTLNSPLSDASDGDRAAADDLMASILIVDDAALMRRRLEVSLNTYGYRTHTCADGLEAWNWLQVHPHPSLMITDIEMPNMDGFTLIDRCRQAGITVPILVISSRLSEEWSDEAKRLGATDYLTKGFATVELIKKVSTLITSPDKVHLNFQSSL
jgi:chemotaxis protein histidine kinase CheA/CheY-like chemotaxis protein